MRTSPNFAKASRLLLLMAFVTGPALALEPSWNSAGNYESVRGAVETRLYLAAAGRAFQASNAHIVESGGKRMFCVPMKLALNPDNYVTIFEKALPRARTVFGERFAMFRGR